MTTTPQAPAKKATKVIKEKVLKPEDDKDAGYEILLDEKAKKISPKSESHVYYKLGLHQKNKTLHLRITKNETGGLHSKDWISVSELLVILDEYPDSPFKSLVLSGLFKGGSANNAGFLAAILRSPAIALLVRAEKSVFNHQLAPEYSERKAALLNLSKP